MTGDAYLPDHLLRNQGMIHTACNRLVTGFGDWNEGSVKGRQALVCRCLAGKGWGNTGKARSDVYLTHHDQPPQQRVLLEPQHRLQAIQHG